MHFKKMFIPGDFVCAEKGCPCEGTLYNPDLYN